MPGQEQQILENAYGHFGKWATERAKFAALLADDVLWVETDPHLHARAYQGKAEVMAHLDDIQGHLTSAKLVDVTLKPSGWQTRDEMQVQGHDLHCCISDIDFRGDLIKKVVHCHRHDDVGTGRCSD